MLLDDLHSNRGRGLASTREQLGGHYPSEYFGLMYESSATRNRWVSETCNGLPKTSNLHIKFVIWWWKAKLLRRHGCAQCFPDVRSRLLLGIYRNIYRALLIFGTVGYCFEILCFARSAIVIQFTASVLHFVVTSKKSTLMEIERFLFDCRATFNHE